MKQKILDLILSRPNIRTVEIADKLDMEPDSVRPKIADEIRSGMIVEEPIIAPNGHKVLSFRFASAKPAAPIVTEPMPAPVPARIARLMSPAMRRASVAAPAPADIDVPVSRKLDTPLTPAQPRKRADGQPTRIELALECLRAANGEPVPTEMLGRAMGLSAKNHPSSYLMAPMRDGRICMRAKMWTLGTAAVDLPAPVVSARPKLSEMAPAAPTFPRADPAALAAYVPGSKRCTMNCGAHVNDPRSAAERAVLCDDCETVKLLEVELAQSATATNWVAQADPEAQPIELVKPTAIEPSAADVWVSEAIAEKAVVLGEVLAEGPQAINYDMGLPASIIGGLPNLSASTFMLGSEPEPGTEALDFSRPGRYENGVFRNLPILESVTDDRIMSAIGGFSIKGDTPSAPLALDTPTGRFVAGLLSDGSLHLRVPGKLPFDLTPAEARELYEFMQTHGYAAWPKAA